LDFQRGTATRLATDRPKVLDDVWSGRWRW